MAKSRTVVEPAARFDPSNHKIRSLSLLSLSDSKTLVYIGTHSGSLILLSLTNPNTPNGSSPQNPTATRSNASEDVSLIGTVSLGVSPVESIFVLDGETGKVLALCDGFLFLLDSLFMQPAKRLGGFLKGVSVVARRLKNSETECTDLLSLENSSSFNSSDKYSSASQRFLQKLGGGNRANGVKVKELEHHHHQEIREGNYVFVVVVGRKLVLIELVLGDRGGRNERDIDGENGSFIVLKEFQCLDGIKTMVWLDDSIIVGTVNGYSLFSCITGQSGVIFSLPDESGLPLLRPLTKEWKVLLLVDNVGIVVDVKGHPVGGSLVFRRGPESVGQLSLYLVVVTDGKMELYHKKTGVCIQTVSFGAKGCGPCIVADEPNGNGKLVAVATSTKVIFYQKVAYEEQIKDLLRKKNFEEAISLVEELQCEGEMSKEMLSFVHSQVGFLLLFDLRFEEAVAHFLQSETMQPSEVFPFIMRDPNRWSLLVPRKRYWGLHPPPAPIEEVIDDGLMAIQRAIFLRKAGVETPIDDDFLSNPPSRADLIESAIKNFIRYLEVSREKDLTLSVREGVDTLLMYLYRALNCVDDMEKLASTDNSCVVELA